MSDCLQLLHLNTVPTEKENDGGAPFVSIRVREVQFKVVGKIIEVPEKRNVRGWQWRRRRYLCLFTKLRDLCYHFQPL